MAIFYAFKNAYHYEIMINDTGFWSKTSEIHHVFYNYSVSFDIGFYFGHNDHLDYCIWAWKLIFDSGEFGSCIEMVWDN